MIMSPKSWPSKEEITDSMKEERFSSFNPLVIYFHTLTASGSFLCKGTTVAVNIASLRLHWPWGQLDWNEESSSISQPSWVPKPRVHIGRQSSERSRKLDAGENRSFIKTMYNMNFSSYYEDIGHSFKRTMQEKCRFLCRKKSNLNLWCVTTLCALSFLGWIISIYFFRILCQSFSSQTVPT